MSSHHKRSRSREPHKSSRSKKQKSCRSSDENNDMLTAILSSLKDLKSDINTCSSRISDLENRYTLQSFLDDQNLDASELECDTISVLAGNEFDRVDFNQQEDLASQPINSAIDLPNSAIQPPNQAIQPPSQAIRPPSQAIQPPSQAIQPPILANQSSTSTTDIQDQVEAGQKQHIQQKQF